MSGQPEQEVNFEEIVNETEKAILFKIGGVDVWLPISEIDYDEEEKWIVMPYWLAYKKELI